MALLLLLRDGAAGSRGFRRGQAPEPRDERRLDGNLRHLLRVGGPHRLLWQEPLTRLVPRHAPVQHQVVLGVGGEHDAALRRASPRRRRRLIRRLGLVHPHQQLRVLTDGIHPLVDQTRRAVRRGSLARPSVQERRGLRGRDGFAVVAAKLGDEPSRIAATRLQVLSDNLGFGLEPLLGSRGHVRCGDGRRTHDAIVAHLLGLAQRLRDVPAVERARRRRGRESGCTCGECR